MERIFYKTDLQDDPSNVPIYIFDTSFLPSPEVINYDEFILTLMTRLPRQAYTLIMFCSGLNKISWIWGVKFLKTFLMDETNLQNLNKIISVHEGWFIKTLASILTNYHLTRKNINVLNKVLENFTFNGSGDSDFQNNLSDQLGKHKNIIINCSSLWQLNNFIDITKLKISLNVYKHDYQLDNPPINKSFKSVNFFNGSALNDKENSDVLFPSLGEVLKYHIYQNFNIINNFGDKVELLFHKPGNKINSEIFINCIKRDQLVWINDWDLYCIATSFKKLIAELPSLIPIELIDLPIKDDTLLHNFHKIVNRLPKDLQIILVNLFHLFHKLIVNCDTTKLTSRLLSKIFINCLSHQTYLKLNEPNLIIVNNFIRKLIDNWDGIGVYMDLRTYSMDRLVGGTELVNDNENSYINYDLTIDEFDSDTEIGVNQQFFTDNTQKESDDELIDLNLSPKKVLAPNNNIGNIGSGSLQYMKSLPAIKSINSTPLSPTRNQQELNLVSVQYPPQKYKFKSMNFDSHKSRSSSGHSSPDKHSIKKPVIRGIKVGELAKLYEERAQGLELLRNL